MDQVKEAFRRMVFNVASHNADDHGKNHSFLYEEGAWRLSPAYDLTFADAPNPDIAAVAARAMPVGGKVIDITGKDLLRLGERAGLSKSVAHDICHQVIDVVARGRSHLKEAGLSEPFTKAIWIKVELALNESRRHLA
jgi:serine/threonine-protein kinase HipA